MTGIYDSIAKCLLTETPTEDIADIILESQDDVATEDDQMSYLLKLEQYLDSVDIYAFKGWMDAQIMGAPEITKFWVKVDLLLPDGTDIEGAYRIIGKNTENRVKFKKTPRGRVAKVAVLRWMLDDIERQNRKLAITKAGLDKDVTPEDAVDQMGEEAGKMSGPSMEQGFGDENQPEVGGGF